MTVSPLEASLWATAEPMKPAAPVMRIFMFLLILIQRYGILPDWQSLFCTFVS